MKTDELRLWITCRNTKKSELEREQARQRLLEDHLPLVRVVIRQMALSFPSATVEFADLFQFGVIGLIKAFDRFDLKYGVEFRSYASYRIRGQVLDELRALDWVPRSIRKTGQVAPLHSLDDLLERKEAGLSTALIDSAPFQEPLQEKNLERQEEAALLKRHMQRLNSRERQVVNYYYHGTLTLQQIGCLLGLTESRICQIHSKAITKMRKPYLAMAA